MDSGFTFDSTWGFFNQLYTLNATIFNWIFFGVGALLVVAVLFRLFKHD